MKKIYTFTLDSDDYPSSEQIYNDIRLMAYMVYETIRCQADGKNSPLNINDNIRYNKLHESNYGYNSVTYKLDSDYYDDGYINYEPFIVNDKTFALTIVDDSFDIDMINYILRDVLYMLNFTYKYKVSVNSIAYESRDNFDESNRNRAISKITSVLGLEYTRRRCPIKRLVNRCSRNRFAYGRR